MSEKNQWGYVGIDQMHTGKFKARAGHKYIGVADTPWQAAHLRELSRLQHESELCPQPAAAPRRRNKRARASPQMELSLTSLVDSLAQPDASPSRERE